MLALKDGVFDKDVELPKLSKIPTVLIVFSYSNDL